MKHSIFLSAVLVILAAPDPQKTRHPKKTPIELTGQVHDKSHKELARAVLTLYNCDDPARQACDKALASTISDAHGKFVVVASGIPDGVYSLGVQLRPYLPRVKAPVNIPGDKGRSFDFLLLADQRDYSGRLMGATAQDAREIYAAARIAKDVKLEALSAQILNDDARATQSAQGAQSAQAAQDARESARAAEESARAAEAEQKAARADQSKGGTSGIAANTSAGKDSIYSIEGCLSGYAGSFMLTDATGKSYTLAGDTSKLGDQVGRQVRISGTPEGFDGSGNLGSSSDKTFTVKKVKTISSSCSTGH